MNIQPATFMQVRSGRNGRLVGIESDVLGVVQQIKEISKRLSVQFNDGGEYFRVIEHCDDGRERLVLTANELDQRIVERLRYIASDQYDYVAELERMDREADAKKVRDFQDQMGEVGERLFHATRKDLEVQDSVYVPGWCKT